MGMRNRLLATLLFALLGAACGPAPEIRQGNQPAPGAATVATATPGSDDQDTDCDVETTTASYLPQKVCTTAGERKQDKDSAKAFIDGMRPR
jgi:hypothetical protein